MNYGNINEEEKLYLKHTNQDSTSVKCRDSKRKCQSILKYHVGSSTSEVILNIFLKYFERNMEVSDFKTHR